MNLGDKESREGFERLPEQTNKQPTTKKAKNKMKGKRQEMKVRDEDLATKETVNPSASRDEEDSSSSPQSAQKSG